MTAVAPTPEQLAALNAEMGVVLRAFGADPILRLSQQALFTAQRISVLATMVLRHRMGAAGVEDPQTVIRAMLRDQGLIESTIGPFTMADVQDGVEGVILAWFTALELAKVTLAELEGENVERVRPPEPAPAAGSGCAGACKPGADPLAGTCCGGDPGPAGEPGPAGDRRAAE